MLDKMNISPEKQKLIIYIVLILVTLAVFWQVNQYDFTNFDDQVYVTENNHIQSGITLASFRWALSTKYFDLWNPLVLLSFMFNYQLYGLNAGGYHLTNLILHILSALLLFWLFNRMTGAIWRSAFVAAFFALHPLHVESVAWIAERKDVLSAFFWMLTLCLYVYYTEKPVIRRYLPVVFCFVLALMSKPMVVTLPVIMIFLDYWPLKRFESRGSVSNLVSWQLKEKTPFFILSAILITITLYTPNNPSVKHFPLSSRIANAPVSFVTYLEKTFWPYDLAVFYPFPVQSPLWQVLGSTLLILAVSVAVIIAVKRLPYLFSGWLWYAITLLPVIGIIPVGNNAMADRYHYLPSIGVAIMLAWGIPSLIKSENIRKKILFPVSIATIAIMAALAWQQCGYWKNSTELWTHALCVTRDNSLAHNNIAYDLFEKGKIKEAIDHCNEAIRLVPDYVDAYNNRGIIYDRLGQYQLAIENYNKAIAIKTDYAYAYYNRGIVYAKTGQYQLAIEDYNKAIAIEPDYADAYNNRGVVYSKLSQYQRAIEDYTKAISLKQDYADAYNNRGITYFKQGSKKICCDDLLKACKLGNCKTLQAARNSGACL